MAQRFDEAYWQAESARHNAEWAKFEETTYDQGYTIADLRETFNRFVPDNDWKAPVVGFCERASRFKVETAIVHFTATVPTFIQIGQSIWFQVKAIGYRAGPAGDH